MTLLLSLSINDTLIVPFSRIQFKLWERLCLKSCTTGYPKIAYRRYFWYCHGKNWSITNYWNLLVMNVEGDLVTVSIYPATLERHGPILRRWKSGLHFNPRFRCLLMEMIKRRALVTTALSKVASYPLLYYARRWLLILPLNNYMSLLWPKCFSP